MNRILKEICFQCRWALPVWFIGCLTNWLPDNRITLKIRGALYKPFFKECGKNLQVARNVILRDTNNIVVGDHVYFSYYAWVNGIGSIEFGNEVIIGPFVTISSVSHAYKNKSFRFGGSTAGRIKIGNGTWLAAHVSVASGVTIGDGCLVAANSAVVSDIPDFKMAGGVPAKVIKDCEEKEADLYSRF